jgi:hypothetical protein
MSIGDLYRLYEHLYTLQDGRPAESFRFLLSSDQLDVAIAHPVTKDSSVGESMGAGQPIHSNFPPFQKQDVTRTEPVFHTVTESAHAQNKMPDIRNVDYVCSDRSDIAEGRSRLKRKTKSVAIFFVAHRITSDHISRSLKCVKGMDNNTTE